MFSHTFDHTLRPDRLDANTPDISHRTSHVYRSMGLTIHPGGFANRTSARTARTSAQKEHNIHPSQLSKQSAIQGHRSPTHVDSDPSQHSDKDEFEQVTGGYESLAARLAEVHKNKLPRQYTLKASPEVFETFCLKGGSDPLLEAVR